MSRLEENEFDELTAEFTEKLRLVLTKEAEKKLEGELESLKKENKELREEIARLKFEQVTQELSGKEE